MSFSLDSISSLGNNKTVLIIGAGVVVGAIVLFSKSSKPASSNDNVGAQIALQSQALANGLNGNLAQLTVEQNIAQIDANKAIALTNRQSSSAEFLATLFSLDNINQGILVNQGKQIQVNGAIENNRITTNGAYAVESLMSSERLKSLPQILSSQQTLAQIEANNNVQLARINAEVQLSAIKTGASVAKRQSESADTAAWLNFGSNTGKSIASVFGGK